MINKNLLLFLFSLCLPIIISAQTKSYEIRGRIYDDSLGYGLSVPCIEITPAYQDKIKFHGDLNGNFQIKINMDTSVHKIQIIAMAMSHYSNKMILELNPVENKITLDIGLKNAHNDRLPELPPYIVFYKDSLLYSDKTIIDSILQEFVQKYLKTSNKDTVEISSYSGFDEDSILSEKRLNNIYETLLSLGFPARYLIKNCRYNQTLNNYFCNNIYYTHEYKPWLTKRFIESIKDTDLKNDIMEHRRIVLFTYKR